MHLWFMTERVLEDHGLAEVNRLKLRKQQHLKTAQTGKWKNMECAVF